MGQERGPGHTVPQCCAPVRCHISVMGSGGRKDTEGKAGDGVKAKRVGGEVNRPQKPAEPPRS